MTESEEETSWKKLKDDSFSAKFDCFYWCVHNQTKKNIPTISQIYIETIWTAYRKCTIQTQKIYNHYLVSKPLRFPAILDAGKHHNRRISTIFEHKLNIPKHKQHSKQIYRSSI